MEAAFPSYMRMKGTGGVLVQKMPNACEYHGHSQAVGGGNHITIPNRTSRLNDGDRAGSGGFFDSIGEREEGIRSDYASGERRLRFHYSDLYGIDAAHLPGADAHCRAVLCEDDGVGFDVLANFPGKAHGLHFFWRGDALRHDFQLIFHEFSEIRLLHKHSSKDALELKFAFGLEATGRQFK